MLLKRDEKDRAYNKFGGSLMERKTALPNRRSIMSGGGLAALAALLIPRLVAAEPADVEAEIKRLYTGKTLADGRIKLDLPSIAENGLVVPLGFEIESAMTEKDYVKAVHIFADKNPSPGVASFYFTPMMPQAAAQLRMRLSQTQNIIVVAELSDGSLYTAKKEVKVTIGGCGG
jgi:sulfur-oxidizing protein SoxY